MAERVYIETTLFSGNLSVEVGLVVAAIVCIELGREHPAGGGE